MNGLKHVLKINSYNSEYASVLIGVPQGSILGPLLFLLCLNDLNLAIKHCKVHHFAGDTDLSYTNNSIENLINY